MCIALHNPFLSHTRRQTPGRPGAVGSRAEAGEPAVESPIPTPHRSAPARRTEARQALYVTHEKGYADESVAGESAQHEGQGVA
jgi:hypothetical protein